MDSQNLDSKAPTFDAHKQLAKLDKYDNTKLSLVIAVAAVISAIFFVLPVLEIRTAQLVSFGFSFAELSSVLSLLSTALTILKMSNSTYASAAQFLGNISISPLVLYLTLFLSLAMMCISLAPRFKKFIPYLWIPALINILILGSISAGISSIISMATGQSSIPMFTCSLSFTGYLYFIVHLAIICTSGLMLYREHTTKKSTTDTVAPGATATMPTATITTPVATQTPAASTTQPTPEPAVAPVTATPDEQTSQAAAPAKATVEPAQTTTENSAPVAKTAPVTKTCPNCGAEVSENAKFCGKCGTSLQ